jgi:hypothetical protein
MGEVGPTTPLLYLPQTTTHALFSLLHSILSQTKRRAQALIIMREKGWAAVCELDTKT